MRTPLTDRAPATDPVVKRAAPGESPRLSIAHDPLKCLSIEARPLVDARVLPGSRTGRILSLCTTSNVGEPGVWRFLITNGRPNRSPRPDP